MTVRNTIRVVWVSLALVTLLVFATVVVSGWPHHHDSVNDAQCPYCHLGHQVAAQPETSRSVMLLLPFASLPLPEDSAPAVSHVSSTIASRAPPSA